MAHISQGNNIALSASMQNEMKVVQKALLCMLSTFHYLASGGLSIRGHIDEKLNLVRLLQYLLQPTAVFRLQNCGNSNIEFLQLFAPTTDKLYVKYIAFHDLFELMSHA
jgi:hypothetical protein